MESRLGQLLQGRYQITQILSSGAFGHIYIAEDLGQFGQLQFVIKHYPIYDQSPRILKTSRRLFWAEVGFLKSVGFHPQISQLITYFEDEQGFYLVQEWIEGKPLSAYLPLKKNSNNCWHEQQVIQLLVDLLQVLDFVHHQGIIHCDLKPNNILRRESDGRYVLIDFGGSQEITHHWEAQKRLRPIPSRPLMAVSPSGYLATEQLIGKPCPSSDIYALGMVAIQALTGSDPARLDIDQDTGEIRWQNLEQDCPYSEKLAAVLTQMIRYDCLERYQSAQDVLQALTWVQDPDNLTFNTSTQDYSSRFPWHPIHFEDHRQISDSSTEEIIDWDAAPSTEELAQQNIPQVKKQQHSLAKGLPFAAGVSLAMVMVNTLTIVLGVDTLFALDSSLLDNQDLSQARQEYEKGNLQNAIALAQSVSQKSLHYRQSQKIAQQWQQELKAQELLQQAYSYGENKNFTAALKILQQIPPDSRIGTTVQRKLVEYKEKQQIRAHYFLQQAYNRAQVRDFQGAIQWLEKIPNNTRVTAIAAQKLVEYGSFQRIQEQIEQPVSTAGFDLNPSSRLQEVPSLS